jgi:hypothetical protein
VKLALDIVERIPPLPLLAVGVGSAVLALVVAALAGGSIAIGALVAGTVVVAVSGAMLATRVHLDRLPLEVAPIALSSRIDGHPAYQFRVRLGRGRLMRDARATVRFVPDEGEPIALEPLEPDASERVGPWTLVVLDRDLQCTRPGHFAVGVEVEDRGKRLVASRQFPSEDIRPGRFAPPLIVRKGKVLLVTDRWAEPEPPRLVDSERTG